MRKVVSVLYLAVLLSLSACNFSANPQADIGTEPAATDSSTVEPATAEAVTAEPTIAPTASVEHKIRPGEFPKDPNGVVSDQDSSITADEKRAPGGDRFTYDRFERPFNSQTMDVYYPYLDIQDGAVYMDDTWVYVMIVLKEEEASRELKGKYGFEIDTDLDGGGDWLILASNPVSPDWTTDGVEAWFDANDDVGEEAPVVTDEHPAGDDGYEVQKFGDGIGDDPDMTWVRVSPDKPNIVNFAIKKEAIKKDYLENGLSFLVGLWAGGEDLDPSHFDLNDHFTHEQAGAALTELDIFYPIKEISELDNTCRMAVGFQSTGKEPGVCPPPPPPNAPEEYVDPGCMGTLVCRQSTIPGAPPTCVCR